MSSAQQQTLTGEEADELPSQFWCDGCGKPHLVEQITEHEHGEYLYESREAAKAAGTKPLIERGDEDSEEHEDNEPEKVGEMYRVTLSYTVDYTFRVPASTEYQAKQRAKDLKTDAKASTAMHVHTETDSLTDIFTDSDKLPDGFRVGDAPLWEVYGEEDTDG